MKRIKVSKGNIPTVCDHIRRTVLAAGNVSFAEKSGSMSSKQIKALMHNLNSIANAKGLVEVQIVTNIFGGDDRISISKEFGTNHISATIVPGDCLIINCLGIAIIRENYRQLISFVKA